MSQSAVNGRVSGEPMKTSGVDRPISNEPDEADAARRVKPAEAIDYQVSPTFMDLLGRLGCSLVISNYQSSSVMCFSRLVDGRPVQMFTQFPAAMGLALDGDRLAIASRTDVTLMINVRRLAPTLPKFPGVFDGYFVPRVRYTVGETALHDMAFAGQDLWAVNTNYSCICRIDAFHSFVPIWTPPFISKVVPGDRCHLNGMTLEAGALKYVTALGMTDEPRGWVEGKLSGGVLMEAPSGRVLADDLCMPHSPRLIGDDLYLLEAGTGSLLRIDRTSGAKRTIVRLPGFARGLAELNGYLFIGLSLVRGSRPFDGLPIGASSDELICGVVALELASGKIVGTLRYTGGCTEIHDLQVVPNVRCLGISGYESDTHVCAIDLPDAAFWVSPPQRPEAEDAARAKSG